MSASKDIKNRALEQARAAAAAIRQEKLGLDGTPPVRDPFNQAAETPGPAATSSDLHQANAERLGLDGTPPSKPLFNQAASEQLSVDEDPQHARQRIGSQMVKDQQPKPELNPPDSHEKRAVDAQSFNAQWNAEKNRAEEALRIAREATSDIKQGAAKTPPSHEQDRGAGIMG